MRFARRAVKKKIEDLSFRRLPSKIACDFLRQTRVLFSAVPRKFMNFRGTRRLTSKIASDFRRQTKVLFLKEKGRIFSDSERSRGKYRKKGEWRKNLGSRKESSIFFYEGKKIFDLFFRCPPKILWIFGGPDLCRRKSQAIFDGRGASPPIPGPLRFQRNLRGPGIGGDPFSLIPIFPPTPKKFGENPSFFFQKKDQE